MTKGKGKIKRIKRREVTVMDSTEAQNAQLEFFQVKQQKKLLVEREEELKKRLTVYMDKMCSTDTKGHRLFTVLNQSGEKIHLQKQARKKVTLNEERAENYLRSNKFGHLVVQEQVIAPEVTQEQILDVLEKHAPHLLDSVTKIDEIGLGHAVTSGEISFEDFENMCDIDITYAMAFISEEALNREREN